MTSPSSSYTSQSPTPSDASATSPSSSYAATSPSPPKKRSRTSPDDPVRQARLIARQARNRQSAQNSRNRKRAEQTAMEDEVVQLRQRNAHLEAKVAEAEKGITALMDLVKLLIKSSVPGQLQSPLQHHLAALEPSSFQQPTQVASTPTNAAAHRSDLLDSSLSTISPSVPTSLPSPLSGEVGSASHLPSSLAPSADSFTAPTVSAPPTSLSPLALLSHALPSLGAPSDSTTKSPSSTSSVCHPAADIGGGFDFVESSVGTRGEKRRRGAEEDGTEVDVDGTKRNRQYGSSTESVEGSADGGWGCGKQSETSPGRCEKQEEHGAQDTESEVVDGFKTKEQPIVSTAATVATTGEDLDQFNHRLASELLQAILGAQHSTRNELHQKDSQSADLVQADREKSQEQENGAVVEAKSVVSLEQQQTGGWNFDSLGLTQGLNINVDLNMDEIVDLHDSAELGLELNFEHADFDRSLESGAGLDENRDTTGQNVMDFDEASWRGLVHTSMLLQQQQEAC